MQAHDNPFTEKILFSLTDYAKKEREIERARQKEGTTEFFYMNNDEQKKAKLTPNNGIYRNADGDALSGTFLYVVLQDNSIIHVSDCMREDGVLYRHSSLANGKKVRGAGKLVLDKGKLLSVSNESGHYKPVGEKMHSVLTDLFIPHNPDLIFEDHTSAAKGVAYQYNAQSFVNGHRDILNTINVNQPAITKEVEDDLYKTDVGTRSRYARTPNLTGRLFTPPASSSSDESQFVNDDVFAKQPSSENKEDKGRRCGGCNIL